MTGDAVTGDAVTDAVTEDAVTGDADRRVGSLGTRSQISLAISGCISQPQYQADTLRCTRLILWFWLY